MRNDATMAVSGSALVCIALTSGAMFGMAAQTILRHFGLDLGVASDLALGWVAETRCALAWWAWWLVGAAAFFVGSLSVGLMRYLAVNWWLFRGPRLSLSATLVLGLAAVGHLPAAPLRLDATGDAMLTVVVATVTALLSVVGAQSTGAVRGKNIRHLKFSTGAAALPRLVQRGITLKPGTTPNAGYTENHRSKNAAVSMG